jgi:enoyl-CoA hydratase
MKIETQGPVAVLRLEAGKANAIGPDLIAAFDGLLAAVEHSDARAVVITGYERFFSAGLDLPTLFTLDRAGMDRFLAGFEGVVLRLFTLPRPAVAAINGHAIAGGCVLAMQADYRFMGAGAGKIGLNEVQLGIGLPAVVIETLRCQVPPASLRPIALEGRLFDPATAQALGLVDEVVPPAELMARSLAKARELAELPAAAFAEVKSSLRRGVAATAERAAAAERQHWLDTWFSKEGRDRVGAAVAKLSGGR